MTLMTIQRPDPPFSVVTLVDRDRLAPWETLFDWPRLGQDHLELSLDTLTQRNLWAARLDEAVIAADRAVLLLASGASCAAAAWWARLSPRPYVSRIAGAFLFAPAGDGTGDDADGTMLASPDTPLPFPSVIVDGDEAIAGERLRTLADGWGSRIVRRPDRARHPAGPPAWRHAQRLFLRLSAGVVARDVRLARIQMARR